MGRFLNGISLSRRFRVWGPSVCQGLAEISTFLFCDHLQNRCKASQRALESTDSESVPGGKKVSSAFE